MNTKLLRDLLILGMVLIFWPSDPGHAKKTPNKVTFQMTADKKVLQLGERLTLTIKLITSKKSYSRIRLPKNRAFKRLSKKKKQSKEMVYRGLEAGWKYIKTYTLIFKPKKMGTFTFPQAKVRVSRKTYKTQTIQITVKKKRPAILTPSMKPPLYIKPKGDTFIISDVSPKRAYMGQQVTVSYYLFKRNTISKFHLTKAPKLTAFLKEQLYKSDLLSNWKIRPIRRKRYKYTLVMRYALFALRTGTVQVDSPVYQVKRSFADSSGQATFVQSPTKSVKILPLPAHAKRRKNTPVGRFQVRTFFKKQQIFAKEPFFFSIQLKGTGNIRQLELNPLPQSNKLKFTYIRSQTKATKLKGLVTGSKSFFFRGIAQDSGEFTLPSYELVFFDPWEKRYTKKTTKAREFKVLPGRPDKPLPHLAKKNGNKKPKVAGLKSKKPQQTSWQWLLLLLPVVILLSVFMLRKRSTQKQFEEFEQAHKQSFPLAEDTLQQLRQWSSRGDFPAPQKMLQQMESNLHALFEGHLQKATRGLRRTQLMELLENSGFKKDFLDSLKNLLSTYDTIRYSPSSNNQALNQTLQNHLKTLLSKWPAL